MSSHTLGTLDSGDISGVSTNSNAATGVIGEIISSIVLATSPVNLVANVVTNITSISLTPGDWDIHGLVQVNYAGINGYGAQAGLSLISATLPLITSGGFSFQLSTSTLAACTCPVFIRESLSITTIIYLVTVGEQPNSTASGYGTIFARRTR